ncbi:MAG: beta-eliminating lyase-related protein [Pseudomonadota bacterium]
MTFASDNWAGASDHVMAVLGEANNGQAAAYGDDGWTARAKAAICDWFERDCAVFFVSTGSAANAIALATLGRPGGVVFAHVDAHITCDEAGGPLLFFPGTQLELVDGPEGRLAPQALKDRLASYLPISVHHGRPTVVSITNLNEIGRCSTPAQVNEISALAKEHGCAVHMDGARFANAVAHLGASPADLSWRAGVDALSLGLTKTGGWCAEAVVFFDRAVEEDAMFRHKQAAQLFSKNRFAAAQFVALLGEDHALSMARSANAAAGSVADILAASPFASLLHRPQGNEVFAYLSAAAQESLRQDEIVAAPWSSRSAHLPAPPQADWSLMRFVASFRTTQEDIRSVETALSRCQSAPVARAV